MLPRATLAAERREHRLLRDWWSGGASGTWAVPRGGGAARLLTSRYGIISPDGQFIAYPEGPVAHIARLDGTILASWETNGRVYFAQQGGRVAWFDPAGDVEAASVSLDPPVRVAVGTISTGAATALPRPSAPNGCNGSPMANAS
ncbi:MAG: hypothetical protein U0232_22405 [Thermomicrobiales bacterium]